MVCQKKRSDKINNVSQKKKDYGIQNEWKRTNKEYIKKKWKKVLKTKNEGNSNTELKSTKIKKH